MVVTVSVLLSVTIWRTAIAIARSDDARRQAQLHRDELLVSERAARERAELADRAKDEFIAALSHELRTPLNAVVGWMQMLQQGIISDAGRLKATDAVARNAGVLARLIEDLLETSRITTGHLELSRTLVDMKAVVQAAVESVMPTAEAKQVAVAVTSGTVVPTVMGDAQRLQQVMWNLLSNAIKFSSAGGKVDVQVSAGDDAVVVRVRDEGYGIAPELLPHVFDRFRQGDSSSTRASGGLGLGLYIAKHLIEEHGGSISAESEGPGLGAVFTIQLPAATDVRGAGGSHRSPAESAPLRADEVA
jgi:signal transduction histidine kinase